MYHYVLLGLDFEMDKTICWNYGFNNTHYSNSYTI